MTKRSSRQAWRPMAASAVVLVTIATAAGSPSASNEGSDELLGPMPTEEVELVVWGPGYADTDDEGNETFSKIIDDSLRGAVPQRHRDPRRLRLRHAGDEDHHRDRGAGGTGRVQPVLQPALLPGDGPTQRLRRRRAARADPVPVDVGGDGRGLALLHAVPELCLRLVLQQGDVRRGRLGPGGAAGNLGRPGRDVRGAEGGGDHTDRSRLAGRLPRQLVRRLRLHQPTRDTGGHRRILGPSLCRPRRRWVGPIR